MRNETQALLFEILEKIDQHDLAGIHVNYEKLGWNRPAKADNIAEEVSIAEEYKTAFDTALLLIDNGDHERAIIDAENSW